MEDYRVMDGYHHLEAEHSIHPAYPFRMSGRDLARFGLLYLREGKWNGKQIISKKWITESTTPYSDTGTGGYAYLWWTFDGFKDVGMYTALGVGTQIIAVFSGANMVMVLRVNTYENNRVPPNAKLIRMILDAKMSEPKPKPQLIPLQNTPSYKRPKLIKLAPEKMKKYVKEYPIGDFTISVKQMGGDLIAENPNSGKYKLFPVSESLFLAEDAERYALFEFDQKGIPIRLTVHQTVEQADLYSDIMKLGAAAAVKQYKEKRKKDKTTYAFKEGELNRLGYQLLGLKKVKDAIEVFKLNVELYPGSFNVYDSLGEAYMIAEDYEKAIYHYKKSLELNPGNKSAEEKLKEIETKKKK